MFTIPQQHQAIQLKKKDHDNKDRFEADVILKILCPTHHVISWFAVWHFNLAVRYQVVNNE